MNIQELNTILVEAGVCANYYCINGEFSGNSEVVVYINSLGKGKYEVYLTERDQQMEYKEFYNEDLACMYFLAYFYQSAYPKIINCFKKGLKYDLPDKEVQKYIDSGELPPW